MLRTVSTQHKMKWQSGAHPVALTNLAAHWLHKPSESIKRSLEKGIPKLPLVIHSKLLHRLGQWRSGLGFFLQVFWFPRTFSAQSGHFGLKEEQRSHYQWLLALFHSLVTFISFCFQVLLCSTLHLVHIFLIEWLLFIAMFCIPVCFLQARSRLYSSS